MPKLVNKFSFSKPKKPKITVFAAKSTDLMIPLVHLDNLVSGHPHKVYRNVRLDFSPNVSAPTIFTENVKFHAISMPFSTKLFFLNNLIKSDLT